MFNKMKISTRIGLGFGAVLLLMIAMGAFALMQMSKVNDASTEIATNWLPSIKWLKEIDTNTSDYRIIELQHVIAQTPEEMRPIEDRMAEMAATIEKNRATYVKLISSKEEQALYDAFSKEFTAYIAVHDRMIPLSRALKTKEAMALMNGESLKHYNDYSTLLTKLVDLNQKGGDDASAAADRTFAQARYWIAGVTALACLLGIAIAVVIVRTLMRALGGEPAAVADAANRIAQGDLSVVITTRAGDTGSTMLSMQTMVAQLRGTIEDVVRVMGAVSVGDLTQKIHKQYEGAYAQIKEHVNNTTEKLAQVVTEVNASAEALASASEEVSATAQSLSQASSEQAAGVEETSASMEQMTASISQNTENLSLIHI